MPPCLCELSGRVDGRGFVKASTAKSAGLLTTTERHLGIVLVVDGVGVGLACSSKRGAPIVKYAANTPELMSPSTSRPTASAQMGRWSERNTW